MVNKLRQLLGNAEIVFVCKTGSQLLCNNFHDTDVIVVAKDVDFDYKYLRLDDTCVFCYSVREFEKFATLQLDDFRSLYSTALLFATGDNVLYGQNPVAHYDWWSYRKQTLEKTLKYGKQFFFNDKVFNGKNRSMCLPKMIWGLATYYVLKNGIARFSEDQRNVLQLCHDNGLPLVYRNVLEKDLSDMLAQAA